MAQTLGDWFPPMSGNSVRFRRLVMRSQVLLLALLLQRYVWPPQAGRRIAAEYEAEQNRIRGELERQRLASNKSFLISIGVVEVDSYLKR